MTEYYIAANIELQRCFKAESKAELVSKVAIRYSIDNEGMARIKFHGLKEISQGYVIDPDESSIVGNHWNKDEALNDFLRSQFYTLLAAGYLLGRTDRV